MADRKKPWTITGFRGGVSYPAVDSEEFTVRVWVTLDPDPQRPVFRDLTADEADALAAGLQARAAEARKRTADWAERRDAEPVYPAVGSTIPDQPGYVVGECSHRVATSEWHAGLRRCERCPE